MPTVRTAQPLPISLPGLSVLSYGTATAMPIGISNDRKTLYGGALGNTLYQSTDDGATWTSVATFAETTVTGLLETDDGEALAFTQNNASPSSIYKSTGWSTSHTTATWTKKLTTTAGYIRTFWGGGHFCSFGNDKITPGTSKYGIANEYGAQTTSSGDQTPNATRAYFTADYGNTWTVVLNLATRYPGVYPLHLHSTAYDPYWDRLWALYGDKQADGTNNSQMLYSDDHGATWATVPLGADWGGFGDGLQSTALAILRDSIVMGSDNSPGFVRLARKGYRKVGDIQVTNVLGPHTGSQIITMGSHRNRNSPGAPLLVGVQTQAALVSPAIYGSTDDGATILRLWADDSLRGQTSIGPQTVLGPTANGIVASWVTQPSGGNYQLRAELITPEAGMADGIGTVTGDGTTTVFSFPHGLTVQPGRFLAWPEKPTGAYTVSATATNIVVTYTTAPVNASSVPFQWRAAV